MAVEMVGGWFLLYGLGYCLCNLMLTFDQNFLSLVTNALKSVRLNLQLVKSILLRHQLVNRLQMIITLFNQHILVYVCL